MLKLLVLLKTLRLHNNQIAALSDQLDNQAVLEYLDLSNNQIAEIAANAFDNQQGTLQKLGLENNAMTTQSQNFDDFNSLTNVCFKNNTAIASSNSIYTNNVNFTVTLTTCCAGGDCIIS